MDPILAMMGQLPDEERRRMMAQMLRGQARAGGALSTSSIPEVASQGQNMQTLAQDAAQNIGLQKAKADTLASQERMSLARTLSSMKGEDDSRPDWASKASNSALEKFEEAASNANMLLSIANSYKDEYQSLLPFRPLANAENAVAQNLGVGNKDQAEWWAALKQVWELPTRNALFGSALTTGELKEWNRAAPSPGESAEATRTKLTILERLTKKAIQKMRKGAERKGWDREYVDNMLETDYGFGDIIEGSPGTPTSAKDMSDEELLKALGVRK